MYAYNFFQLLISEYCTLISKDLWSGPRIEHNKVSTMPARVVSRYPGPGEQEGRNAFTNLNFLAKDDCTVVEMFCVAQPVSSRQN